MAYVAIKGGEPAIKGAAETLEFLRIEQGENAQPIGRDDIRHQLRFLHGRVLSEGGLYDENLAADAIKQSMGDTLEASFIVRAYCSTKPRLCETPAHSTEKMRVIRRISAAFKDIQGGQFLGPTFDYALRLIREDLKDDSTVTFKEKRDCFIQKTENFSEPQFFPKVLDELRKESLLPAIEEIENQKPFDITREPLIFPVPRSAALASMARSETGGILALAYSTMRGFGDIHPTIGELRVGYLPVEIPHPITGELIEVGEVLITECEIVAKFHTDEDSESAPQFTLGYGACFGQNESKAISIATLDRSMQSGKVDSNNLAESQEFVLLHTDGIESMGSVILSNAALRDFPSRPNRLRTTREKHNQKDS